MTETDYVAIAVRLRSSEDALRAALKVCLKGEPRDELMLSHINSALAKLCNVRTKAERAAELTPA
jgi:hypothetical protein